MSRAPAEWRSSSASRGQVLLEPLLARSRQRNGYLGTYAVERVDVPVVPGDVVDDDAGLLEGGCAGDAFAEADPRAAHDLFGKTDGEADPQGGVLDDEEEVCEQGVEVGHMGRNGFGHLHEKGQQAVATGKGGGGGISPGQDLPGNIAENEAASPDPEQAHRIDLADQFDVPVRRPFEQGAAHGAVAGLTGGR